MKILKREIILHRNCKYVFPEAAADYHHQHAQLLIAPKEKNLKKGNQNDKSTPWK